MNKIEFNVANTFSNPDLNCITGKEYLTHPCMQEASLILQENEHTKTLENLEALGQYHE